LSAELKCAESGLAAVTSGVQGSNLVSRFEMPRADDRDIIETAA
jgi:hypothetical protein